jgi:hypothetical protein
MNAIEIGEIWTRWFALGRLQARFLARSSEIMGASLSSVSSRGERLFDLWLGTPWPWLITRIDGPLAAGARWADYLEDETRNAAQAAMLTDWEMRDWGERFARTVEGEESV